MAWVTITADDVVSRINGTESNAYRVKSMAAGDQDPLPEIVTGEVQYMRSRIAANPRNVLGAAGTIPDGLLPQLLSLVIYRLIGRYPIGVSEDRRRAYNDARTDLEDIAKGTIRVENPTSGEVSGGASTVVSNRTPMVTVRSMRGL